MAIINNPSLLSALQSDISNASAGAASGRFFDLDNNSNSRQLTGLETANNPGGIRALGGNDTIFGNTQSSPNRQIDVVNGNTGNDQITGNRSARARVINNDIVLTGDYLRGGSGNDLIFGVGILNGNAGSDLVTSFGGGSFLRGGQGDDVLLSLGTGDTLIGDLGTDAMVGLPGTTYVLRSDTVQTTAINSGDIIASSDFSGSRIVVAGNFLISDLSFEQADVVSFPQNATSLEEFFARDGNLDVVIRRASTRQVLGIVSIGNVSTSIDLVRGVTEVTPLSDPALAIG